MNIFLKIWKFLATKILTLKTFDLFLQGSLLIVILLEHNAFLLLRRTAETSRINMMIDDWALICVSGVEFLMGVLVAWWGRGRRSLALAGWLGATAVCSLIVLAFPFDKDNRPVVELCGGTSIAELSRYTDTRTAVHRTNVFRTVFLIITLVFAALAKISIWAHGLTLMDDVEPTNGTFFYGILISIQLSLGLSGKEWLRNSANQDNWWEPHLSISMLTLMFSILFLIFPKIQTQYEGTEEDSDNGLWSALKRVFSNKPAMLQIGAFSFITGAIFRFFHFDREYTQARFQVDVLRTDLRSSRLVSTILRPIVIIFFIMIFRVRFSLRRADGVKPGTAARVGGIVAIAAAVAFSVIAALSCGEPIAGQADSIVTTPSCASGCGCDYTQGFTPVCGLNTSMTYFSPCAAGCRSYEDLNGFLVFRECSCDSEGTTRGACSLHGCHIAYSLYQVFVTLVLAIGGAAMLMQGMSLLRTVQVSDKPLAMGVLLAIVALTGQLLTHFIYLAISRETCALFNRERCDYHRPTLYIIAIISIVFTLLSGAVSLTTSFIVKGGSELLVNENRFETNYS